MKTFQQTNHFDWENVFYTLRVEDKINAKYGYFEPAQRKINASGECVNQFVCNGNKSEERLSAFPLVMPLIYGIAPTNDSLPIICTQHTC